MLWLNIETSKKSGEKKDIMQPLIQIEHLKYSASQETNALSVCKHEEHFLSKHSHEKTDKDSKFIKNVWDSVLMGSQKVALPYQSLHCGCQMWAIKLNLLLQ